MNQKLKLTDRIILYYLILYNQDEIFYKIGITKNTVEERYRMLYEKTGYKIVKVRIVKGLLREIVDKEQTIHRKASRKLLADLIKYKPKKRFGGGNSECYVIPPELLNYHTKLKMKYDSNEIIMSIYKI